MSVPAERSVGSGFGGVCAAARPRRYLRTPLVLLGTGWTEGGLSTMWLGFTGMVSNLGAWSVSRTSETRTWGAQPAESSRTLRPGGVWLQAGGTGAQPCAAPSTPPPQLTASGDLSESHSAGVPRGHAPRAPGGGGGSGAGPLGRR